jgi:hypothetical protein
VPPKRAAMGIGVLAARSCETALSLSGNECRLRNSNTDGTQLPMEGYLGFESSRQVKAIFAEGV